MSETLEDRIDQIGRALRDLCERLSASGYVFQCPDEVLPGPEANTEHVIEQIGFEAGAVPLALALFWRRVGSVNLCGAHPAWAGCEYPDPLVVYPPSVALADLDEFVARDEADREGGFVLPISPDDFHKADVSGGMFYNVRVPAVSDDPPLDDERHGLSFVDYLELALRCGGFPGLEKSPGHSWPVFV